MEENNVNIEFQAGAALAGDGISFEIKNRFGIAKKFTIKPLKPDTLVRISQQVTLLEPIEESENMVAEMLAKGNNLKPICKIIAMAVLNDSTQIILKSNRLAKFIQKRTESIDILYSYLLLVYKQMSPNAFFFIMNLTMGMNMMKKKQEKTKAAKPSGVQSG